MLKLLPRTRYAALSGIVVLAITAYTIYWFTLAGQIETGMEEWAGARRADGMVVEYSALEVTGFPLRMQAQATNVRIAGPGQNPGWQWRSALLIGNVLPYNINHIVFTAPQPQEISIRINGGDLEQYQLEPQRAQASLKLKRGKLARADLDIEGGTVHGGRLKQDTLTLGRIQVHIRDAKNGETAAEGLQSPTLFDISLKLENLDYPGFANSALGTHVTRLALTGAIEGVWPTEKGVAAIRQWRDAGGVIQLKAAETDWGPLKLNAAGTLALDAQDRLIGSLTANLLGYEDLIRGLQGAGQLSKDEARAANTGLGIIAMAAGAKDGELTLPMVLQDGELFVGPLRIAKLKPLY